MLLCIPVAILVDCCGAWAYWVEPHGLELNHLEMHSAKVTEPMRIALIADIQTDKVGEHERRALRLALDEKPDMIIFAGDYVQLSDAGQPELADHLELQQDLRRLLLEFDLAVPLGAYAVAGNCDSPQWTEIFDGLPVRLFDSSGIVDRDGLRITGLAKYHSRLGTPVDGTNAFHIVVGHHPDFALGEIDADLIVAGHCHGGQIRVPFFGPLMTLSRIPRAWTSGMNEIRPGTQLVVSRGIGVERGGAPRLRFLCRPEVVVIDVLPVNQGQ
jgi:hypothetical protein